ncbi:MAG: hypothetical protein HC878_07390 [Leptolyngbyaceae cyanobacterium SL_5_14]|nr:hypothetical protein [Leptolyngbyaceae cyanobacterium SL_5_14]
MKSSNNYPIEKCPKCDSESDRPHSLRFKPVCGKCRTDLPDPYKIGEEVWWYENNIPVKRLAFELLPPGSWGIDDVIAYYHREAAYFPTDLVGQTIELERLSKIKKLNPKECYVGTNLWLGYVVFTFDYTSKVVLECPIEGNATYVLLGDWQSMVKYSKQELRDLRGNSVPVILGM